MYRLNPSNYHHKLRVISMFGAMILSSLQTSKFLYISSQLSLSLLN